VLSDAVLGTGCMCVCVQQQLEHRMRQLLCANKQQNSSVKQGAIEAAVLIEVLIVGLTICLSGWLWCDFFPRNLIDRMIQVIICTLSLEGSYTSLFLTVDHTALPCVWS